jgi:hypothetical protein
MRNDLSRSIWLNQQASALPAACCGNLQSTNQHSQLNQPLTIPYAPCRSPVTRNPHPATRNPQRESRNPQPATRTPQLAPRNSLHLKFRSYLKHLRGRQIKDIIDAGIFGDLL